MRTGGPDEGLRCRASTGAATAIANGLREVTGIEPKLGVVSCRCKLITEVASMQLLCCAEHSRSEKGYVL